MTRIRLYMLAAWITWLSRTCHAQFSFATSSASAGGGAIASAGGVTAVAQLPQIGFGFGFSNNNNWQQQNGNYQSYSQNSFYPGFPGNNLGGQRRGGMGHRPPMPGPMAWGGGGGGGQSFSSWGSWQSIGGRPNPPGWGRPGFGGGGRPPPPPPGWGNGGGRPPPPGWGNGGRPPPPGWGNGGRPAPPGWEDLGPPPGWNDDGNDGVRNEPTDPQPPTIPDPTPTTTPRPRPTAPLPSTQPTHDTLIEGTRPPLIISPTPPKNSGDTLIVGTNRPPLVLPTIPTPTPTPLPRSSEITRLRDIIFPSSSHYVQGPSLEIPAGTIDVRRR